MNRELKTANVITGFRIIAQAWYRLVLNIKFTYCVPISIVRKMPRSHHNGNHWNFSYSDRTISQHLQNGWVIPLWPGDSMWRYRYELTLAQAMVCCLTAPSHYPNQCCLYVAQVMDCCLSAPSHYPNQYWLIIRVLEWRHNRRDGVWNHQPPDCLLNRLFRHKSKKHQSPRHWPLWREFTGGRWIPRTKGQ